MDAPVAPLGIFLRQSEDERSVPRDRRSTGPAVRVSPALGDEVAVPAEQGCRLDEEASETPTGQESCQAGQDRPVGRLQRGRWTWRRRTATSWRSMTTSIARSLSATDEPDQLEDAAERPIEEREGHRRMLATFGESPGPHQPPD